MGIAKDIGVMFERLPICPLRRLLGRTRYNRHTPSPAELATSVIRVNERFTLVHGIEGDFLTLNNDIGVSQTTRETGVWAKQDVALFKQLIRPGMRVADIGANIGHHTVVFSKYVGPSGKVIACEPQQLLFRILIANLALNNCNNVVAHQSAVGESTRLIKMWPVNYDQPDNFGALGTSKHLGEFNLDHPGEDVQMIMADELLTPFAEKYGGLEFMKLDIQAYELFCLRGAFETICRYKPMMFIEISPYWMKRMGYDYSEIYNFFGNLGYKVFEPHQSLKEPAKMRIWDGDQGANWDILALP